MLTTGYTIKGIIREDAWDIGRSSPDKEHNGGSESKENQGVDRSDLLSSDEGEDST